MKITTVLDALDTLGLALVAHGHKWTKHERSLYELAVTTSSVCGRKDSGSQASAIDQGHAPSLARRLHSDPYEGR